MGRWYGFKWWKHTHQTQDFSDNDHINPDNPRSVSSAEVQRKRQPKFTFRQLIDYLEPYSLYPREEIIRLIKMTTFVIMCKLKQGYRAQIPNFGEFYNFHAGEANVLNPQLNYEMKITDRDIPKFKAYPYLNWFMAPNVWEIFRAEKIPGYFKSLFKYYDLFWQHPEEFKELMPDKAQIERCAKKIKDKQRLARINNKGYNLINPRKN